MARKKREYKIVVWHGEIRILFYVVEVNPKDEADWTVIGTYHNQASAQRVMNIGRSCDELRKDMPELGRALMALNASVKRKKRRGLGSRFSR
ncbi:MAG: hypothetical protein ABSH28_05155 [Acidobacteriota bacterium]